MRALVIAMILLNVGTFVLGCIICTWPISVWIKVFCVVDWAMCALVCYCFVKWFQKDSTKTRKLLIKGLFFNIW